MEQWSDAVSSSQPSGTPKPKQLYGLDRRAGINRRESQIKIVERKICQYV
jgi:hypothetical protein